MNNGRILVVDDEPQIRRVIRTTLQASGFQAAESRTGEESIEKLRLERFDLILLDSNMPGMGGLAACREIRKMTDAAVIMLTVRNDEQHKIDALDAGADDYVTKPFSTPELMARIRAALRRLPASLEPENKRLVLETVEIDLVTRRVHTKNGELRLTPKEFELLNHLISNPNVPIPHGRLLQAVWGPEYGGEVEYLRVFINQLRKKIEPDPARPIYLLTEPWVGYRFQPPANGR